MNMKLPILKRGDRLPAVHYGAVTTTVNDINDNSGGGKARFPRGHQWFETRFFGGPTEGVEVDDDAQLIRAWCVRLTTETFDPSPAMDSSEFPGGEDNERNREWVYFICMPTWFVTALSADINLANYYLFGATGLLSRRFMAHWSTDRQRWETDYVPTMGLAFKALETYPGPLVSNEPCEYAGVNSELWLRGRSISFSAVMVFDEILVHHLGTVPIWEDTWGTCIVDASGVPVMTNTGSATKVRGVVTDGDCSDCLVTLDNLTPYNGWLGAAYPEPEDQINAFLRNTNFQIATGVIAWAEYNILAAHWEITGADCAPPEESDSVEVSD